MVTVYTEADCVAARGVTSVGWRWRRVHLLGEGTCRRPISTGLSSLV
jgi:hypothetical protein